MAHTNFSTLPTELRQKIFTHLLNLLISSNYHLCPRALSIMAVSRTTRSETQDEWIRRLYADSLENTLALRESVKAFCHTSKLHRKGMMYFFPYVKASVAHKQKSLEMEKRLCKLRLVDEQLKAPKTGGEEREGCVDWADRVADGEAGWPFTDGPDCEG